MHRCPVGDCPRQVDQHKLMCPRHWGLVPRPIQNAVYRAWNHGQGAGSKAHRNAMLRAVQAAKDAEQS